jgi:hypothetical protein
MKIPTPPWVAFPLFMLMLLIMILILSESPQKIMSRIKIMSMSGPDSPCPPTP